MSFPHSLPQEEALRRVQGLIKKLQSDYAGKVSGVREQWDGPVGRFAMIFTGMTFTGAISVGPSEVNFEGNLPFAASFFRGAIEKTIRDTATRLLSNE